MGGENTIVLRKIKQWMENLVYGRGSRCKGEVTNGNFTVQEVNHSTNTLMLLVQILSTSRIKITQKSIL